jgi:hypothetical protein
MLGTAVAQKAAAPKAQDKLALAEEEDKELLLLYGYRQERQNPSEGGWNGSGVRQAG